ncbi:putative RNA-directed DNA polymerase [Rosa chinensis]|uniref:Putative RNA-directed DNA polymerase n=1 Tax=Rosa chinensis TaxID=74649 RepID=A0A2P6S2B1_ROSCH|nr:putative RNA-directed DNA polymerase [Rosa chinensis]
MTTSILPNQIHTTQSTIVFLPNILLDETNYPTWLFRMESFLRGQNLFGFVDGTNPCPPQFIRASDGSSSTISVDFISWKTQDQSIVNMIGQTLSPVAMTCALKSNLQNVKKGSDDIETYLDKIKTAKDALETVGVAIDDDDIVVTVLNGLPSEFAAIKTVIRAQFTSCSLSQLKTLLKAAEMDIGNEAQGIQGILTAMIAKINTPTQASPTQSSCTTSSPPSVPVTTQVQSQMQTSSCASSSQPQMQTPSYAMQTPSYAASTIPPGFSTSGLPAYPISAQTPYMPIPAMPYGFTPFPTYPVFNTPTGVAGFYAGRGTGRSNNNVVRGYNNNNFAGGRGTPMNGNTGGFRPTGNTGNNLTCQWCNKVGHGAKTCRSLPNAQNANNSTTQGGCQYCGRHGHTVDRCYFIIGFPGQQSEPEETTALLAATNLAPQYWLADTGATNHMTHNPQVLNNVIPYPTTDGVQIGNGNQLAITHIGNAMLGILKLDNILLIPDLAAHLLSIYQLCKQNNCSVWFDEFMCVIQDKVQGKILYQGLSKQGLYPITFDLPIFNKASAPISGNNKDSVQASTTPQQSAFLGQQVKHNIWHQRLGHPANEIVKLMLQKCKIEQLVDCMKTVCEPCLLGKFHKLHFSASQTRCASPFELVHSDVWGSSPHLSIDGYRYFVLFIDDCTRFTWVLTI